MKKRTQILCPATFKVFTDNMATDASLFKKNTNFASEIINTILSELAFVFENCLKLK